MRGKQTISSKKQQKAAKQNSWKASHTKRRPKDDDENIEKIKRNTWKASKLTFATATVTQTVRSPFHIKIKFT